MILTICSIKGGVGKSLIATNLTAIRSINKKRVLLCDADTQKSSSDWTNHRIHLGIPTNWTTVCLTSSAVRSEILKLAPNYDDVIIDCGGRDNTSLRAALTISNFCLIPFQPKSFDIWTATQISELLSEVKIINPNLIAYGFINCGGLRGSDNEDAESILGEIPELALLPTSISLRKSFSNAISLGLSIIETQNNAKAVSEMLILYDLIFKD